jgi:hypothetical protein
MYLCSVSILLLLATAVCGQAPSPPEVSWNFIKYRFGHFQSVIENLTKKTLISAKFSQSSL